MTMQKPDQLRKHSGGESVLVMLSNRPSKNLDDEVNDTKILA